MTQFKLFPIFKKLLLSIVFVISLSTMFCVGAEKSRVCFKDKCFYVELATTSDELYQGLMFRDRLGCDRGMLFIFKKSKKHGFWMKNTYIPLDIIWINQDKEVVFIKERVQSCEKNACQSIYPNIPAKYVLEVNEGVVERIGLKLGDKLIFYLQQ